jgi:hypothetical protein
LGNDKLHLGLATESLIETLLNHTCEAVDVMELPFSEADRNLLAAILLKEDEPLSAERLEAAVRALRRIQLRRRFAQVQQQLKNTSGQEPGQLQALLEERVRLKRALMDPGLVESPGGAAAGPAHLGTGDSAVGADEGRRIGGQGELH